MPELFVSGSISPSISSMELMMRASRKARLPVNALLPGFFRTGMEVFWKSKAGAFPAMYKLEALWHSNCDIGRMLEIPYIISAVPLA